MCKDWHHICIDTVSALMHIESLITARHMFGAEVVIK